MLLIGIINKIQLYLLKRKLGKYDWHISPYDPPYDPYEFIWGIRSNDDMSGSETATFYTMNDFDVIYNKETKTYKMSVETIYSFPEGESGEKKYLQNILNRFTQWMQHEGFNINKELELWDIFTDDKGVNTQYKTIEELYAVFKLLVKGFNN